MYCHRRKDEVITLEELYGKIMADDELKDGVAQAAKDGKIVEWAAEQGVETTEEEIREFVKGAANQKLSVEDVDKVAGGGYVSVAESLVHVCSF